MALPLRPPVLPQLAKSQKTLPEGDGWVYEPKWDGFRSIAFVDGDRVHLQSRNGKPLTRYFPELAFPEGRYVLDGEIVLFDDQGRQDFDALGQRIHPAKSRIDMLAEETPTRFIAFDVLAIEDESLLELPQRERRDRLEQLVEEPVDLTPASEDPAEAQPWLQGAEGVVAKRQDAPVPAGRARRDGEDQARAHDRRASCAAGGPARRRARSARSRSRSTTPTGNLREVGHCSGFTAKQKRELPAFLAPYETGERFSAEPSRWNAAREMDGAVVRPELVVEVTFDHTSNERIRHGTKLLRWRDDKDPRDCLMDQLES